MTDNGETSSSSPGISEVKKHLFDLYGKLDLPTAFSLSDRSEKEMIDEICSALQVRDVNAINPFLTTGALVNIHLSPLWIEYAKRCGKMEDTDEGDQRFLALVQPILNDPDVLNFILLRIVPWVSAFGVERAEKLLNRPLRREIWDLRQKHFNLCNHDAFISAMKVLDRDFYFRRGVEVLAAYFLHYGTSPPPAFQLVDQERDAAQRVTRYEDNAQSDMEFIAKLNHPDAPEILFSLFDCGLEQFFWPSHISELLGQFFPDFVRERMNPITCEVRVKDCVHAFCYVQSKPLIRHLIDGCLESMPAIFPLEDVFRLLLRHGRIEKALEIAKLNHSNAEPVLHHLAFSESDLVRKLVEAWLQQNPDLDIGEKGKLLRILFLTNRQHDLDPSWLAQLLHHPDKNMDERYSWEELILSLLGKCKKQAAAATILSFELRSGDVSRKRAACRAIMDSGLVKCADAVEDYLTKLDDECKSAKLALLHAQGGDFNSPCWNEALEAWFKHNVPADLRVDLLRAILTAPVPFIKSFLQKIHPVIHSVAFVDIPLLAEMVNHAECGEYRDWLIECISSLRERQKSTDYYYAAEEWDGDTQDVTEEVAEQCRKWLLTALVQVDTNWAIEHVTEYPDLLEYIAIHSLDHGRLCFKDDYLNELGKRHIYSVQPSSLIQENVVPRPVEYLTLFWEKAPNGDYKVKLKHRDGVNELHPPQAAEYQSALEINKNAPRGGELYPPSIKKFDIVRERSGRVTNQWKLFDLMIRKHPKGPTFWEILECIDQKYYNEFFGVRNPSKGNEQSCATQNRIRAEIQEEMDKDSGHDQVPLYTRLDTNEKISKDLILHKYIVKYRTLIGDIRKKIQLEYRKMVIENPGSQTLPSKLGTPFTKFVCKIQKS